MTEKYCLSNLKQGWHVMVCGTISCIKYLSSAWAFHPAWDNGRRLHMLRRGSYITRHIPKEVNWAENWKVRKMGLLLSFPYFTLCFCIHCTVQQERPSVTRRQPKAESTPHRSILHVAAEGVFVWLSQSVYSGYLSIPYSHLSNILCYYSGSQLTRNGFHTLPNYITKSRANRNTGIFGTACLRPSSGNNPTHSCKCHFEQKALWHTVLLLFF